MGLTILNELDFRGLKVSNAYLSFIQGIRITKHVKKIRVSCNENDEGAIKIEKPYMENEIVEYYKEVKKRLYNLSGDLYYYANKSIRDNHGNHYDIKYINLELETVGSFSDLYKHIKDNKDEFGIVNYKDEL